jgi:hypothetical protein
MGSYNPTEQWPDQPQLIKLKERNFDSGNSNINIMEATITNQIKVVNNKHNNQLNGN